MESDKWIFKPKYILYLICSFFGELLKTLTFFKLKNAGVTENFWQFQKKKKGYRLGGDRIGSSMTLRERGKKQKKEWQRYGK